MQRRDGCSWAARALLVFAPILFICGANAGVNQVDYFGGKVPVARPPPELHAHMARWLVHISNWGTVSTQSSAIDGFPYGNAVAISDGPPERATGRIFFYMTEFDQTAIDLEVNPKATLNVCEAQMAGECDPMDPEDPRCAKATIIGEIKKVPPSDLAIAEDLMFRRHPQMRNWHAHKFTFYEMHVSSIRLLDYYGGYEDITAEQYYQAQIILQEMMSDPCWKFPHRFYCVEDRFEEKKKQMVKKLMANPKTAALLQKAYASPEGQEMVVDQLREDVLDMLQD